MTAPDPREPKPCPRCGETCTHDGWGHVHPNGIGIGSCGGLRNASRRRDAHECAPHCEHCECRKCLY